VQESAKSLVYRVGEIYVLTFSQYGCCVRHSGAIQNGDPTTLICCLRHSTMPAANSA